MFFRVPTNTLTNARKDLYIAPKDTVVYDDYGNEIVTYKEPFYFGKVNYQPMTFRSLQSYMSAFGETKNNIIQCLIDYKDKDKIKDFDKAYLYGVTPTDESVNGEKANYLVRSCRKQNTKIMVILEEIIKEGI